MSDDYEIESDRLCPKCGHPETRWRRCMTIGCDDGWIDMHEYDDPLWFAPGEEEMCQECHGTGIERWCPNFGADLGEIDRIAHFEDGDE